MPDNGLQIQTATANTIESHIWRAIIMTKLRPPEDMPGDYYSRCARTDKGVSAFQNVITIQLRSKLKNSSENDPKSSEYDYVTMLNAILPPDIRILNWACLEDDPTFDSRHNCIYRTYEYIFPVTQDLNLEIMQAACQKLIGCHDYRNFCKINLSTARTHIRRILSAEICDISEHFATLRISSTGFLYHQIRLTMTVLLQIGLGNENLDMIDTLLDVENNPQRPQYCMSSDLPLILTDCRFEQFPNFGTNHTDLIQISQNLQKFHQQTEQEMHDKEHKLNWQISAHAEELLTKTLSKLWFEALVNFKQVEILLKIITENNANIDIYNKNIYKLISRDFHVKSHVKFSKRDKCLSLEDEILLDDKKKENRNKRRKIQEGEGAESPVEAPVEAERAEEVPGSMD